MARNNTKSRRIILTVVGLLIVVVTASVSLALINHLEDTFVDDRPNITDPRLDRDEAHPEGEWVVAADEPRYMSIDKLGITNARIVGLGIKSDTDNQLDDPKNIHDVGWYNKSAKPGHATASNMAGLYDGHNTGYSADGVFINLGKLTAGDLIKVERGDGQVFNYEVREVKTPLLEDIDMSIMQKSVVSGVEGLNIISCGGSWDESRQTYTHRVTIRAVLMSS